MEDGDKHLSTMGHGLLKKQRYVYHQQPMPVDDLSTSSSVQSITGETVSLYYSNAGSRTIDAGQAAGTAVVGQLANKNILDVTGADIATLNDTSLSFTGTCFTTQVAFPYDTYSEHCDKTWAAKLTAITSNFANGEYCVDYTSGVIYGKKATTASSLTSTSYKINLAQNNVYSGSTGLVDDTAFTAATSTVTPVGFVLDDVATDTVDENDIGAARMSADRKQIMAGDYVDDTAFTPAGANSYVHLIAAQADETGPDSVDEGDVGALRMTLTRFLKVSLGDLISGEDQTNNILAVIQKPTNVSTYTPDLDTSAAAEKSSVTKAAAGNLYGFSATNSNAAVRYLQFFNSTTVPADSTVPVLEFVVPANGGNSQEWPMGRQFSTGISWCFSTTSQTKTIITVANDALVDVNYK